MWHTHTRDGRSSLAHTPLEDHHSISYYTRTESLWLDWCDICVSDGGWSRRANRRKAISKLRTKRRQRWRLVFRSLSLTHSQVRQPRWWIGCMGITMQNPCNMSLFGWSNATWVVLLLWFWGGGYLIKFSHSLLLFIHFWKVWDTVSGHFRGVSNGWRYPCVLRERIPKWSENQYICVSFACKGRLLLQHTLYRVLCVVLCCFYVGQGSRWDHPATWWWCVHLFVVIRQSPSTRG